MILEFDIGNSALKWRLLDESARVVERGLVPAGDGLDGIPVSVAVDRVRLASVADAQVTDAIAAQVKARWGRVAEVASTGRECAGLKNSYREPARMGVDRWLAMLAAYHRYRRAVLVVDAGTALTLDFVDDSGQHAGGYILPGQQLTQRSLLTETRRVRFSEPGEAELAPGCSTAAAVRNGAWLALGASADYAARQSRQRWCDDFALVITGGDGALLANGLADSGQASQLVPDLVFDGLAIALP